ncbi:hypothetical protein CPB85DRAFT_1307380 [Mucidula mucida]|nr:hypothetical protein CPB85DRAFT_1307380 [Mucidula mucida]
METATVSEEPQPQALPTQALAYKYVTFVNRMATDSGSGASKDISVWRPNLDADWYYLGQGAESNWNNAPLGIVVHALEPDALRDVVGWERVWDDAGSHKGTDFALWRGIPPNDEYVVVGGIFSTNKGWAEPDYDQRRGIKAIRRNLLVTDDTFQVWNDKGTHAAKDGSVWKTWSRNGASPWALIPVKGYDAPPRDMSFSLDRSKTLLMPGEWTPPTAMSQIPLATTEPTISDDELAKQRDVEALKVEGGDE